MQIEKVNLKKSEKPANDKIARRLHAKIALPGITASIYEMTPPYCGYQYVRSSASHHIPGIRETYLFGCDANGKILDYMELPGSTQGILDPDQAIRNAGYVVVRI